MKELTLNEMEYISGGFNLFGAASGFENSCSFSRAFRTRFGVSPSLYRSGARALSTDPANPMDRACGAVA